MSDMQDAKPFDAMRYNIESTVLSSDDSGTQVIESLLMDIAVATVTAAEQTAALVEQQKTANLIALQRLYLADGTGPSQVVFEQIHTRLDLK